MRGRRGFTLVEILIGMIISSMIVGSTFAAYLAAHSSWERCRASSTQYQYGRAALSILEQYVRAALPPDDQANIVFEGQDNPDGEEDAPTHWDSLHFASSGSLASPGPRFRADLSDVKFSVVQDPGSMLGILVMSRRNLPADPLLTEIEKPEKGVLVTHLVRFNIIYFNGNEWLNEWVMEKGLPKAVEIALEIADPGQVAGNATFTKLIVLNLS
jgi:prepilin-type N-terminal cleavage/methylation domain-containing protein